MPSTNVKDNPVGNKPRPAGKRSRDLDDMINRGASAVEQMGISIGKGTITKGSGGLRGHPAPQPRVPGVWRKQCCELPCDPIILDVPSQECGTSSGQGLPLSIVSEVNSEWVRGFEDASWADTNDGGTAVPGTSTGASRSHVGRAC